jgi:hypothetical protein
MTNKSELDEVKAELAAIKRQLTPTPYPTEAEVAQHRDKVHQANEARASANATVGFSRGDLAAMKAAAPDDVCRDLARDGRSPLVPKGMIPDSDKSRGNARVPVNTTGWQMHHALRNGIGEGR